MSNIHVQIAARFPNLSGIASYKITSPLTTNYNCIAWAAEVVSRYWWPSQQAYWPPGLPLIATLDNFIAAFRTLGYEPCDSFDLEKGFNKLAIYVDFNGVPTHMARQLQNGSWTSKLGDGWDIEHCALQGLEGALYGKAAQALRRSNIILK